MKFIFIIITIVLSACSAKPYVVKPIAGDTSSPQQAVYILSHGWHTGIVVSAKEMTSRLPALKQRFGSSPYLEFGWGDKGFYQAKEITSGLTLKALLWPTETVMHVVAVAGKVAEEFPTSEVSIICLNDSEYSALLSFIVSSFQKNASGEIIALEAGLYGDSQFYKGEGDYYLMNTCNKWTAKALQSAGMDISPTFKLTADSVMDYIANFHQSLNTPYQCEFSVK